MRGSHHTDYGFAFIGVSVVSLSKFLALSNCVYKQRGVLDGKENLLSTFNALCIPHCLILHGSNVLAGAVASLAPLLYLP